MNISRSAIGFSAACVAAVSLSGCDQHAAEIAILKADNEHLRAELAQLRSKANGKDPEADNGKPDLTLSINDLWTQRFSDSVFRSKQRLSGKLIRVTGYLDNVSADSVALYGIGKSSRGVRMNVNLNGAYAAKIAEGLGELQKGTELTMQGKFAYERMVLDDSVFVNKETGKTLTDPEIRALAEAGPALPVPATEPEKQ